MFYLIIWFLSFLEVGEFSDIVSPVKCRGDINLFMGGLHKKIQRITIEIINVFCTMYTRDT